MVMARDVDMRRIQSLTDRVQTEGHPWFFNVFLTNATVTAEQSIGSINLPSLTKAVWIENVELSSNRQLDIQFNLGGIYNGVQAVHRVVVNPGVPAIIPVRQLVRPSILATGISLGQFRIRNVLDATATGAYVFCNLTGIAVYDDLDLAADKVMLVVGDSILNGTSGITDKTKSMEWMVRNYFRTRGKRIRIINKSISGSTSVDHERYRAHGAYDFPHVDYLHYQLGTNDAGNVTTAAYKANVAAMIAHKKALYPNAQMVVWGSTPRQNNTVETALIALRTAAQEAVAEANDSKVKFASLATAFDRTVEANYAAADTSGDKVHPNDASHAAAFGLMQTALNGWNTAQLV